MAAKFTAEQQRKALIAFKSLAEAAGVSISETTKEALQSICESLFWLENHREECKLAVLIKRDVAVKAIFEQFPEAKISEVRRIAKEGHR